MSKVDEIPSPEDRSEELKHPSPEQMMMRQAVKYLTPKQKKLWNLYNFDRLNQVEIAAKLNITQQVVAKTIIAIEKRITKWIKSNIAAYNLLKEEYGNENWK